MTPEQAHIIHIIAWVLGVLDVLLVGGSILLTQGGH